MSGHTLNISSVYIFGLILINPAGHALAAASDMDFRLFTSPDQRYALDQARRTGPRSDETHAVSIIKTEENKPLAQISIRGYVQRNNALNTVWTQDGSTLRPQSLNPDVYINSQNIQNSKVPITVGGETVNLKPGQVYAGPNRRIRESMENVPDIPLPSTAPSIATESSSTRIPVGPEAASALVEKSTRTILPSGSPP